MRCLARCSALCEQAAGSPPNASQESACYQGRLQRQALADAPHVFIERIKHTHAWCKCRNAIHESVYHHNTGPLSKASEHILGADAGGNISGKVETQGAWTMPRRKVNLALMDNSIHRYLTPNRCDQGQCQAADVGESETPSMK